MEVDKKNIYCTDYNKDVDSFAPESGRFDIVPGDVVPGVRVRANQRFVSYTYTAVHTLFCFLGYISCIGIYFVLFVKHAFIGTIVHDNPPQRDFLYG